MKIWGLILILSIGLSISMFAQTSGELTVEVTTSETGGNFAPRNIVAIWIENDQGEFIKTLLAYAQNRKTHLNTWQAITNAAGTEFNTTDAITGATRSSHSTRNCSWDGTDYNLLEQANGNYFVWMELTDKNNTGNYTSFSFTKGEETDIQEPDNAPSFADISIIWTPDGVSIPEKDDSFNLSIVPNPSRGIFKLKGDQFDEVEIRTVSGRLILKTKLNVIDISNQPGGIYLAIIKSDGKHVIKKIIKE